jgi:hypothetical protein
MIRFCAAMLTCQMMRGDRCKQDGPADGFPDGRMHCAKRSVQRLLAPHFDRQMVEFQKAAVVLDGFTAPGTPITEATGWLCQGKGEIGRQPACASVRSGNALGLR